MTVVALVLSVLSALFLGWGAWAGRRHAPNREALELLVTAEAPRTLH